MNSTGVGAPTPSRQTRDNFTLVLRVHSSPRDFSPNEDGAGGPAQYIVYAVSGESVVDAF